MKLLLSLALLLIQTPTKWTAPFKDVGLPAEPAPYLDLMKDKQELVKLDGDTLSFLFKSKQEKVDLLCNLNLQFKKIPDSDVWIARAQMPDWDKAFFDYSFVEGGYQPGTRATYKTWRGEKAPPLPERAEVLKGTLKEYTIKSKELGEDRKITVYIPPHAPKNLPAIFMADGQGSEGLIRQMEPLILKGKIRPIAIIATHAGAYKGDRSKGYDMNKDFRAREYLKMADPDQYAKHLRFFCDEVVPWATKEFDLSNKREDRAIQGYSNGGAFAATAAVDRPEVFGYSLPFSVAAFDRAAFKDSLTGKKLPKFYFAAGTLETFIAGTQDANKILIEHGESPVIEAYVSGHDMAMWSLALVKYVQSIFPAK